MQCVRRQEAIWGRKARAAMAIIVFLLPSGTCFASEPVPMQELLQRTGKLVEDFVSQLSGVRCKESVNQVKFEKNGKVKYKADSVFDSLLLLRLEGDNLSVEESRQVERQSGRAQNPPLLVTSGFSTLALVFHPYYQASFEFRQLDDEALEGKRHMRVQFQHVRGMRSPTALQLRGQEYPLELSGIAWIDPDTGEIAKIQAGLRSSMEDLGLKAFQSEVHYAPVLFAGITKPYWLPTSAVIDVETPRQHWRNTHHFAEYRRFTVNVQISSESKP